MARRLSLVAGSATLIAAAAISLPAGASASPAQPSLSASCQGQVNGYYNRSFGDGGKLTSAYVREVGGRSYSDAVTLGAQSHDCNVPAGVPAGEPK